MIYDISGYRTGKASSIRNLLQGYRRMGIARRWGTDLKTLSFQSFKLIDFEIFEFSSDWGQCKHEGNTKIAPRVCSQSISNQPSDFVSNRYPIPSLS